MPPSPQGQQPYAPPPAPPQGSPYQQPPPPQGPYGPQGPQYQQGGQWPPQGHRPPPQGPGWTPPPPPPGPYGQWQRPQPRKRSGGAAGILIAVFGSVAAVFLLLVVAAAIFKNSPLTDTTSPVALPTHTPRESDRPIGRESDQPTRPTERPTRQPTQEPTQEPAREPTQEPSRPPEQETVNQPAQVSLNTGLTNNTMYRAGALPRTNCRAGNANIYSHSQLKALILKTGKCMDQAWGPILNRQGIDWSPPGYAIAAKRGRGACGDYPSAGNMVPYYCPRNNTIYASTSAMARGNGNSIGYGQISSWHGAIISMMAHEYGHHVQNITGILGSHWQKHLDSSSKSGRLALSRKLELQATCFGGMFMRAVASSYPVTSSGRGTLYAFYARVGDFPGYPRDHGSPANNNRWFRQGWEKNKAFQCNTWLAPASTTS